MSVTGVLESGIKAARIAFELLQKVNNAYRTQFSLPCSLNTSRMNNLLKLEKLDTKLLVIS